MGFIDCHVHLYPADVVSDPQGWADAHGEHRWALMVAPRPDGRRIQGWADVGQLIVDMDSAGIERAILQGWYWEHAESCIRHNRFMAECIDAHPERLSAVATFHAAGGEASIDDLRRARDSGFVGMGELCPPAQGYLDEDPTFERALLLASEWKWPVTLHVTEPAGRSYPGRVETPLNGLVELARRHPEVPFVLAHWGGLLPFFELNAAVGLALANVHYDTAASPLIYGDGITRAVASVIGTRRILFGSDYPILRRGAGRPEFNGFLDVIRNAELDEDSTAAVLGRNARELYRLP